MSFAVVLFKMPRLLEDIVQDLLSDQSDLELVGSVVEEDPLLDLVDGGRAAIVVEGADTGSLGDFETRLLYRRPSLRVVQVALDGRTAAVWQLRPDRTLLSEVSSNGLIEAIRAAASTHSLSTESQSG